MRYLRQLPKKKGVGVTNQDGFKLSSNLRHIRFSVLLTISVTTVSWVLWSSMASRKFSYDRVFMTRGFECPDAPGQGFWSDGDGLTPNKVKGLHGKWEVISVWAHRTLIGNCPVERWHGVRPEKPGDERTKGGS